MSSQVQLKTHSRIPDKADVFENSLIDATRVTQ